MHLTRHSDYTMRLLMHLALQSDGTSTIRDIAKHYQISRNHLMKVANRAVQMGYVTSVRGRVGGLKLAKAPTKIRIGQVLRNTEEWDMAECFDPTKNCCPIAGSCGLQPALTEALAAYLAVLDSYTLADIVHKRVELVQILGLKTA